MFMYNIYIVSIVQKYNKNEQGVVVLHNMDSHSNSLCNKAITKIYVLCVPCCI
jgi:hypothetical protein